MKLLSSPIRLRSLMPATKEVVIRTHIDAKLKEESEAVLKRLGLSLGDAIRLLVAQITLRKGLPFEVILPQESNDDILMPAAKRQALLDSFYED